MSGVAVINDQDLTSTSWSRFLPTFVGMLSATLYSVIGVVRYNTDRGGNFDLGIFCQSAQAWSQGRWPSSAIRGGHTLLADHFSPITALFGLAWRLWPDPRALILTQAIAVGTCVGIIAWAWRQVLDVRWLVVPFLLLIPLSQQIVAAVYFDVHEVGLGAPGMALLAAGLLLRRQWLVAIGAVILLLTKEDLGLTVMAAGAIWWLLTRRRRFALQLVGLGIAGVVVAFTVIYLAAGQRSVYLGSVTSGATEPSSFAIDLLSNSDRWAPLGLFVISAGFVGLRSPLALLAVPTLAWRFLADNPAYWQTYFHYGLMLSPIAAIALADVLARQVAPRVVRPIPKPGSTPDIFRQLALGLALLGVAAAAWGGLGRIKALPFTDRASYRLSPTLQDALAVAAVVPDGATIAVEQSLGPALIARLDVRMLSIASPVTTQWILFPLNSSHLGAPEESKLALLEDLQLQDGVQSWVQDNVVLIELPKPEPVQLPHP